MDQSPSQNSVSSQPDLTPQDFNCSDALDAVLSVHHGPQVAIRVASSDRVFHVSRGLLAEHSPYFARMFFGPFQEGQAQEVVLQDVEGVVSEASVATLLMWIYTKDVKLTWTLDESDGIAWQERYISVNLEFLRCADMYGVRGAFETTVAESLMMVLREGSDLNSPHSDIAIYVTEEHMASLELLPADHPVRREMVGLFVSFYLKPPFDRTYHDLRSAPRFSADVLVELLDNLGSL
ncbi:Uncharacterized protein PECH_000818 [Penicillium ucsense]|uniref:BTB domain-containing protein n=1 Tax=Penicillium ucsense TaxID=2839758 RepID=A0A8J8WG22_9EURO|nr:Uncharacterized protein PECM_000503 [Penicillium ucsense]KAF7733316.1 Uncharacterized protein PECH_000818 [Penicillium ucsense]